MGQDHELAFQLLRQFYHRGPAQRCVAPVVCPLQLRKHCLADLRRIDEAMEVLQEQQCGLILNRSQARTADSGSVDSFTMRFSADIAKSRVKIPGQHPQSMLAPIADNSRIASLGSWVSIQMPEKPARTSSQTSNDCTGHWPSPCLS